MPVISKFVASDGVTYDITDGRGMFVGTCSTAAASQVKAVTITSDQNFVLRTGAVIAVKFTYSNTYKSTTSAPCKMNVNSTGDKNIYYTNTATLNNSTSTIAFGTANYYHFYVYDGTNWVWNGYSNESNTTYSGMTAAEIAAGTGTTNRLISPANLKTAIQTWETVSFDTYRCICPTASGTAAKVAQLANDVESFVLRDGMIIGVEFVYSNTQTDTSAHPITLNVCGTGAYRIAYGDGSYQLTNNERIFGYAGRIIYYMFQVDRWVWLNCSWNPYDAMTQQEASAGSVTEDRVISPKVLHDSILEQTTPIENAVNDIAMDGTKNKLQNTASSTGIFTVYDDGTVKATVPASNSQTSLVLYSSDNDITFEQDMVLSGCPADGSYVYKYAIYLLDANGNIVMVGEDGMADEGITRVIPAGTAFRSVRILIRANIGAQTLTFKPMLCDKDLYSMSPDYIPYAPSNRELYEAVNELDQIKFTPETSVPTSSQRLLFSSPRSNNNLTMLVGKLDSSTNYVQFYVNGVDKGYIKFDVSRNINTWQ